MTIPAIVAQLRQNFNKGITRSLAYRQQQLTGLRRFITECERKIEQALFADLGKSSAEVLATETSLIAADLKLTQKNLAKWMKPKRIATTFFVQPGKSYLYPEPLGVVLIISPWNYPINLTLMPLIGALAAGNCVVLKPSEVAPATSALLAEELPNYIDPACLAIVQGAVAETTALLDEQFDHILYTGNGHVGRIVMAAAAKHLTPVTLELGGKSPCIVDKTTNLDVVARRIIWSKFTNAGQTCVTPDYVLAHADVVDELLPKLKKVLIDFYGDNPKTCRDYGRIINTQHYQRLMKMIPENGDVYTGGEGDEKERYIAPTILKNASLDAPAMQDEIFGPILPVLTIKDIKTAIEIINARPKPLSLYLFSSDKKVQQQVLSQTSAGSVSINFPMLQVGVQTLPFGGVGASGMGTYHGKASFDTFTHYKGVLIKPTWLDPAFFYPPYSKLFKRLIRWVMF